MNSVADRILEKMTELGLKHKDLVGSTGASKGAVSHWLSGVNTPSGERLLLLARLLKVTPDWILTGITLPGFQQVEVWDNNTPLDDDEVEIPFFKDFSFACGSGAIGEAILLNENRKLRISKSTLRNKAIDQKNAIATLASGDSMTPTIKDGDTIHIDLGRDTIKDGKIFAICHGGLFLAKRLYNLPLGGVRITSDNSEEFPEIYLSAQDVIEQQFEVVGWIWQISSMENW